MNDIPTLKTARLVLRAFLNADAAVVQRLAGDRAIADTTLNIPHPYEDGVAEKWIESHREQFAERREVTLAIALGEGRDVIGAISLMSLSKAHARAELGYWVGRPFWNSGFCTEAGRVVLAYAFNELGLNRVYAVHLSRNAASGRVLQKLGMKHEGSQEQHVRKWDVLEDIELYGLLAQDWARRRDGTGGEGVRRLRN